MVSDFAGLCCILRSQPGCQWLGIISGAGLSDAALTVPFGAIMLHNVVKLKKGVTQADVELAMGEMGNVVKNTCGDDEGGFIRAAREDAYEPGYEMRWQGVPED